VDKVDNDVTQKLWPPDSVLFMMRMTRQEWNLWLGCLINKDEVLLNAVAKGVAQRRQDDLARVKRQV